jgi:hypothetical protein
MVETDRTSEPPMLELLDINKIIILRCPMFASDPNEADSELKDITDSVTDRMASPIIRCVNSVAVSQQKLTKSMREIGEYFLAEQCSTDIYINDTIAFNLR